MTKESGDVAKAVGLISMNGFVVVGERFFEILAPDPVEFAEPFADEAVEV